MLKDDIPVAWTRQSPPPAGRTPKKDLGFTEQGGCCYENEPRVYPPLQRETFSWHSQLHDLIGASLALLLERAAELQHAGAQRFHRVRHFVRRAARTEFDMAALAVLAH